MVLTVAALVAAGFVILWTLGREDSAGSTDLFPVDSIAHEFPGNHLHGIGFDHTNDRLFLATHFGLFVLQPDAADESDDWSLFQVGDSRDDYMGFSLHPSDPNVVYTSGHPQGGGNLGVLRSDDGGFTFVQVFDGPEGEPVDFHSMTISPANPDVLYGYYWGDGNIYRTLDGGQSWEWFAAEGLPEGGLCWAAPCLAADPHEEATLYAGTEEGLMVSDDGGQHWEQLGLMQPVAGVGVNGETPPLLLAMAAGDGLVASSDGGSTWEPRNDGLELFQGELVFAFAFDRSDSQRVFLATTGQRVFQSTDGGANWKRILE